MKNNILDLDKIGFIDNKEFLPNFFDEFNTKNRMRQLFLNLVNCMIPKNCRFEKYEQKTYSNYDLKSVFLAKLHKLKPVSNVFIYKTNKIYKFNFCKNSTLVINNYNKGKFINIMVSNSDLIPYANFLTYAFKKNKLELLVQKDYLFHEFITKKLKKIHPDKTIINQGKSLCIIKNNEIVLKIYNSWKNIDKSKLNIKNELDHALNEISDNYDKDIYLIYPKNKNFNKHIELKINAIKDKKNKIKLIPYSLRSVLRQTI